MADYKIKLKNDRTGEESYLIKNTMKDPIITKDPSEATIYSDNLIFQHLVVLYYGSYTIEKVSVE